MSRLKSTIYELQKKLKESHIEFIFSGIFSQGLIEEMGLALKERLQFRQVKKSRTSSAFFTFVEQTQNIKHYEMLKEDTEEFSIIAGSGVIAIANVDLGYCINSGNIISNKDIKDLKQKLDKIRAMDQEELNAYFRQESRREVDMNTKRAGLGLIQIARKASGKIEYQFEKIDEHYSYYILTVMV